MIIRIKFLRNDEPFGRDYSYRCDDSVSVGDIVSIDGRTKGIVTQINVPEEEIESFKDRVKSIYGKEDK